MSCAGLGEIKHAESGTELSNVYYCLQGIGLDIVQDENREWILSEKETYQISGDPAPTSPDSVATMPDTMPTTTVRGTNNLDSDSHTFITQCYQFISQWMSTGTSSQDSTEQAAALCLTPQLAVDSTVLDEELTLSKYLSDVSNVLASSDMGGDGIQTALKSYQSTTNYLQRAAGAAAKQWNAVMSQVYPDWPTVQQSVIVESKLDNLKNERDMVFNSLVNDYNKMTTIRSNAAKVSGRTDYIKDLQDQQKELNRGNILNINQDTATKDRQIQVDQYYNAQRRETLFTLRIILVCTVINILIVSLKLLKINIPRKMVSILIVVIYSLGLAYLIVRWIRFVFRSKQIWDEVEFPSPDDSMVDAETSYFCLPEEECGTGEIKMGGVCVPSGVGVGQRCDVAVDSSGANASPTVSCADGYTCTADTMDGNTTITVTRNEVPGEGESTEAPVTTGSSASPGDSATTDSSSPSDNTGVCDVHNDDATNVIKAYCQQRKGTCQYVKEGNADGWTYRCQTKGDTATSPIDPPTSVGDFNTNECNYRKTILDTENNVTRDYCVDSDHGGPTSY